MGITLMLMVLLMWFWPQQVLSQKEKRPARARQLLNSLWHKYSGRGSDKGSVKSGESLSEASHSTTENTETRASLSLFTIREASRRRADNDDAYSDTSDISVLSLDSNSSFCSFASDEDDAQRAVATSESMVAACAVALSSGQAQLEATEDEDPSKDAAADAPQPWVEYFFKGGFLWRLDRRPPSSRQALEGGRGLGGWRIHRVPLQGRLHLPPGG